MEFPSIIKFRLDHLFRLPPQGENVDGTFRVSAYSQTCTLRRNVEIRIFHLRIEVKSDQLLASTFEGIYGKSGCLRSSVLSPNTHRLDGGLPQKIPASKVVVTNSGDPPGEGDAHEQ